jgi:very-short-patch-repair endonuclease
MEEKTKKFIEKARKKHGGRYDYSKVEYKHSKLKVCIICPEHGEFWQTPAAHIRGHSCPFCSNKKRGRKRMTTEKFIEESNIIHHNIYSYKKAEYINGDTKVCITCPKHGDFMMLPYNHLTGQGCPKCKGRNLSREDIILLFREKHGDKYDYSKVEYRKMMEKVCIICPEHGEFWQSPQKHINGQGCPKCGGTVVMGKEEFISRSNILHNGKYRYEKIHYVNNKTKVEITCLKHGSFWQTPFNHLKGHGCPKCVDNTSVYENEICDFIQGLGIKVIKSDRTIITPYELDIVLPEKNIAIEFDGLYWHSSKKVDKGYHLMKTELCEQKGIHLIHIFEDEWLEQKEIVKEKLKTVIEGKQNFENMGDSIKVENGLTYLDRRWFSTLDFSSYDILPPRIWYVESDKRVNENKGDNLYQISDCGYIVLKLKI